MALVSKLQDKDGVSYDLAAVRMSGTRTITLTGDITGSTTTTLEGAVSVDTGIADNAVDTSCISDGAVTTSKIADTAVTLQKLSSELQTEVGKAHTHTNKSLLDNYAAAGSASIPTYIANDGTPTACTDDFVHDAELTAEATTRANADTQLQTNIDAEATTRGNADTALGNRITVLEAKTALSDFEDDITQQTYDATSEDPISGKGVAEALTYGGASWKEVGHGGSSKEYRIADINFGSYGNYVGKTWKFDWTVASNNNSIAFSPDGTLNIQITSRGTGYVPLVALSLTRTPGSKMALNLPTFKLYQLEDTSDHTIRYILSATAGNSAYMGAFYKLTAAYNQQGKESDITLYEKTELVLPEGYEACDTTRNVSYQTAYTNSATAVGSSTAPVYVDANGKVTACGSSLAVSVTGNAATATKLSGYTDADWYTSSVGTGCTLLGYAVLSSTSKGFFAFEVAVCSYLNGSVKLINAKFGAATESSVGAYQSMVGEDSSWKLRYGEAITEGSTTKYPIYLSLDALRSGMTPRCAYRIMKVDCTWVNVGTSESTLPTGLTDFTLLDYRGNADTATKATQDASGNVITSTYATKSEVTSKNYLSRKLLTSSDSIAGTNGQFTNFYFLYNSVPSGLPSDFPANTGGYGYNVWGQDTAQERVILYANNIKEYHWERALASSTAYWYKVYTTPDTTYSNTSDNALSAAATANSRGLSINLGWNTFSSTPAWVPVAQVVTTNTTASFTSNYNLSSAVTLTTTGGQQTGTYDCTIRFNSGVPTISNHGWGAVNAGVMTQNNRPYLTVTKNADNITWTITLYIKTKIAYSGVRFWNLQCTTYTGSKQGEISELTHTAVTTEPTGDYTSLAAQQTIARAWNSSFGEGMVDVGSSTKPVYMASSGTITECGNSLAVSVTGNAATATKATQDASGNVITSTYATVANMTSKNHLIGPVIGSNYNIDTMTKDGTSFLPANKAGVYLYSFAASDLPSGTLPAGLAASGLIKHIVRLNSNVNNQVVQELYVNGVTNGYYVRSASGSAGLVGIAWTKVYYAATSTYDATGTQQVNGVAVASALSSYMPLSRLKPSTDMAGFDSDDTNAYTGKAIGQKITDAISGQIGGWLGNKTVAEINAMTASSLKSGDYATMTDGGTITLGSVVVQAGDEIYWVPGSSVWQKKDNSVYVKKTDIAKTTSVGVVKSDSSTDGRVAVDSDGLMSVNGWSTVKSDITTAQTNITTLQSNVATHTTDIATINTKISAMDLPLTGGDGKYIKSIQETDGVVTAIEATLDTEIGAGSYADNAPTSAAVKTYTDAQVSAEATARDTAITNAIAQEATARDAAISSAIATEVTNRNTAIANAVHVATYIAASETLRFNNMSFTV